MAAIAVAAPCGIESAAAQAMVRGRVVSESTRAAIAEVEIAVMPSKHVLRTGPDGGFRLILQAGPSVLELRRVGFAPLRFEIHAVDGDTLDLELTLTPAAQELPPVEVTSPASTWRDLSDRERRRRAGIGTFITTAELRELEPIRLSGILRQRGVPIRPLSRRGTAAFSHRSGRPCPLAVYRDGVFLGSVDPATREPWNLDDFPPRDLEWVEIYQGAGTIPVAYSTVGTRCGVLLLWTRRGP